jgi:hypothetical protein
MRQKESGRQPGDALRIQADFICRSSRRHRPPTLAGASEIALWQQDGNHAGILDDDVPGEHVAITSNAVDDPHKHIQLDPFFGRANGIYAP